MERRTIGAAALEVGAIGLGCMPMSWGYTASQRSLDTSLAAVHAALDQGCSLLDTADMYGPFTNELLLGRALKERRADAFVSTKCGLLVGEQHIVANGRPGYVKRACDASLRRLQTDRIDLYQLHRADPEVPIEETWGAMAELVAAGKVRSLGLCAVGARAVRPPRAVRTERPPHGGGRPRARVHDQTLRQLERIQQVFPVSSVEAELSVWSAHALEELLPWCDARGVGLLAAMPLGNGYLTGTLTPGQGFEPEDLRARHPRFTAEMMAANQPLVAGLRRIGARHGATPGQVALAWVLAQGRHVIAVPGTKKERWAVQNARAAQLRLERADLAEITALRRELDAWY